MSQRFRRLKDPNRNGTGRYILPRPRSVLHPALSQTVLGRNGESPESSSPEPSEVEDPVSDDVGRGGDPDTNRIGKVVRSPVTHRAVDGDCVMSHELV